MNDKADSDMIKKLEHFMRISEEMLERNELDTCINRLYIIAENSAAIILKKFSTELPSRHDKMANAIENLYKMGNLSKDFSRAMRRLYELHLSSDYGKEANEPTKDELQNILSDVKELLKISSRPNSD